MTYEQFVAILNRHIFQEERRALLEVLVTHPERFVGLFRPSKPESKLFQHIFQAREIKFGDAMEEIVSVMLQHHGYRPQNKRIAEGLECDHYFLFPKDDRALLIEQKVRDDHDSTKRRGQWRNFEEKVLTLASKHPKGLLAVFYFLDPTFRKNQRFYAQQAKALQEKLLQERLLSVQVCLWYGEELFKYLTHTDDWRNLIGWLKCWKESLPTLPDVNWETEEALQEICEIARSAPQIWRRFATCESLWNEGVVDVLFPSRQGLQEVLKVLSAQQTKEAERAAAALRERLTSPVKQ